MFYDMFPNLELANSGELFRSEKNLVGYGLIPHPADPKYNPDGLPVGLSKTAMKDSRWKGEWVGLGCAACHNGRVEHRGATISISGGNNKTLDLNALIAGLNEALTATVDDRARFDRLAKRSGQTGGACKEALRERLEANAAALDNYWSVLSVAPGAQTFFAPPGMGNRSVARKDRPKKFYAILHWQYAQIVY